MPNAGRTKKRLHCSVQLCGYSTLSWTDLSRHMRKHTGEKPYQCDKCDKKYRYVSHNCDTVWKATWSRHQHLHVSSRQDKLVIHKRVHEGRRPFACPHCKYTAVDSSNLKKHVRSHTGYKPYKCHYCSYVTSAASQLVVHTRKHTGDCPYLCMVENCGAAFKAPSDFKRHLRCHTGEKPFKCSQCSFEAAVKSNLSVHLRKHHSKAPVPAPAGTPADTGTGGQSRPHQDESGNSNIPANGNTNSNSVKAARNAQKKARKPRSPKSALARMETESGGKPTFSCQHCKYKVTRSKTLELHMRRKHKDILEKRSGVDPATATQTQSSGESASAIKKRKAFTCSTCSASFVQEKSLKCHMRQHVTPIPISVQPAPSPIVISVITYADSRSNCYPKSMPAQPTAPGQK